MSDDIDTVLNSSVELTLVSGTKVVLERLKARQFFRLLRIVTRGAGPNLGQLSFSSSADEFTNQLVAMLLISIPEAEDEVIDFLAAMVKPVGLKEGRKLSKEDREKNSSLYSDLAEELYNPELEDLLALSEAIIRNEAEDLQALGKRLMGMFNLAVKTGQVEAETVNLPTEDPSPEKNSSEDSAEQSI